MIRLVLHEATQSQLDQTLANPSHALLLLAQDGAGKASIAKYLAAALLQTDTEQLTRYPYIHWLQPTGNAITIDNIRTVQRFLQLKTTGDQAIRRVVCIEHAEAMTQEAQNALLKSLEEPPADTVIILTARHKRALLPTILSRIQTIPILRPSQEQLESHFAKKDASEVRKAYFLSGGLPGLMHGILHNDDEHPLLKQVTVAKDLLQKSAFERLALIDSLCKQPEERDLLLDALERIAGSGLAQAGKTANTAQLKKWHALQKETFAAKEALAKNANAKLVLTNMLLNF